MIGLGAALDYLENLGREAREERRAAWLRGWLIEDATLRHEPSTFGPGLDGHGQVVLETQLAQAAME